MIPLNQSFPNMQPISGTIDEILSKKFDIDIDSDEHCYQEIMNEYGVTKKRAIQIYKKVKLKMVQIELDKLVNDGIINICGFNKNGQPLYKLAD